MGLRYFPFCKTFCQHSRIFRALDRGIVWKEWPADGDTVSRWDAAVQLFHYAGPWYWDNQLQLWSSLVSYGALLLGLIAEDWCPATCRGFLQTLAVLIFISCPIELHGVECCWTTAVFLPSSGHILRVGWRGLCISVCSLQSIWGWIILCQCQVTITMGTHLFEMQLCP